MAASIKLIEILQCLDNYVLLKLWPEFPDFSPGGDLDLLVLDKYEVSGRLKRCLDKIVDGTEYYLRVIDTEFHLHLDIMKENNIHVRFDLIDNFDFFTRFSVKQWLITEIFMTRNSLDIQNAKIFIPSKENDLLLRYFEYLEYFEQRPEKIKHLDFIANNANQSMKEEIITNAHKFISFRRKEWVEAVPVKVSFVNKILANNKFLNSVAKKVIKAIKTIFV